MITESQYQEAAKIIGCDTAMVKAVKEVEAPQGGFLENGDIRILFEPHRFWVELQAVKIKPVVSDICYKDWKPGKYGKESAQMGRLAEAIKINETAALKSASYGLFQILGANHLKAGYKTVQEMVADYKEGEFEQLKSFCRYVVNTKISKYMVRQEFAEFAKNYNGPRYKENEYDIKLMNAYKKYLKS